MDMKDIEYEAGSFIYSCTYIKSAYYINYYINRYNVSNNINRRKEKLI